MFSESRRAFFGAGFIVLALVSACDSFSFGCGREPERSTVTTTARPVFPSDAAPRKSGDPRLKVVCLGDSLTAGLGLIESQAYPNLLQQRIAAEKYEFDIVNAGVSGDTSAGGLRRLDWSLQGDVKVLILALGANDALRGLPVKELKANLAAIIERARARGVTVILAGMEAPPNFGPEYTTELRAAYADLASQYQTPFVPFLLDKVAGQSALNQGDGIHPNAEGAEIIAETVWTVLRPILQQLSAT